MRSLDALVDKAERLSVKIPTPETLKRYGWSLTDWLRMLDDQGWVCPICDRFPSSGRFVTDHEHVRGWAKMDDDRRALYVRGLTCWTCNRYLLARDISVETAERVALYLRRYGARRP